MEYIVVFTANGKGKTTAALAIAHPAAGHGVKTLMIQFVKEKEKSGKQEACPALNKNIEIYPLWNGVRLKGRRSPFHIAIAEKAWSFMEETLHEKNTTF